MQLQKPLVILAALALAGTLIGTTVTNVSQSLIIGNQAGLIQTLSSNSDALRSQVKDAGETPIAPKAATVVGEAGAAGKAGGDGVQGPRGFTGDQGVRGDTGATGVAGMLGATGGIGSHGLDGTSGADGANGTNGTPGSDGTPGAPGADSTVPGPAGSDGKDGKAGQPGEPPMSWTFTSTPGGEQTCTRTDPFDPASPTYTCTATPAKETP